MQQLSLQQLPQICPWPALGPPARAQGEAFPLSAHQLNFAAVTDSATYSNGLFVSNTNWICLGWGSTCTGLAAAARSCH